uniref:Isopentenyl-diphosphate Delta-isomerase n=3 Tax=Rhodobacter capsulatus TaxID=1061 RepID=IDI_RHOCB|nr:isopentenyl-diphosphate Delta-isomerase [Rhodobacter capsulatus]P26173.1 RecName: Full=Isopentenyl-diphosphate Delta-isomerase; Short=IPP isomerase; AltName: Full=Bacteriochlorophyll synthase 20 kDa chain; AltName: Full=IPP:DMAPP isomerase; AltName: Full=Isopentenyl pyrophosphate isomerase [Rhodobacter capsulatus SB 1003]CAA77535.1 176 aa (20 kD) bacteriochlorophyll synthase subunit [Rhodobacter capsulatus]
MAEEMIPAWVEGVLQPVEKLEAHRKGLRHLAISVFVTRGNKVLLQQRALSKYHTPGLWANTCCTHPYWGEDAPTCAARRLGQELGIVGLKLRHMGQLEYRADVNNGMIEHEVVEVFTAEAPEGIEPQPDPEEVADTEWVRIDALRSEIHANPERFTPWLKIYIEQHRDMIFPPVTA